MKKIISSDDAAFLQELLARHGAVTKAFARVFSDEEEFPILSKYLRPGENPEDALIRLAREYEALNGEKGKTTQE